MVNTLKGSVPLGTRRKPGARGSREAHEGTGAQATGRRGGETPKGRKTPGGQRPSGDGSPHRWRVSNLRREQSLEGDAHDETVFRVYSVFLLVGANVTKVTASERGQRLCEGEKPWRTNPMSGTGMKQGRKVLEDVSRQEGEKP